LPGGGHPVVDEDGERGSEVMETVEMMERLDILSIMVEHAGLNGLHQKNIEFRT
jgi:hypothetical protein